jgi:hypothetical protein
MTKKTMILTVPNTPRVSTAKKWLRGSLSASLRRGLDAGVRENGRDRRTVSIPSPCRTSRIFE